MTNINPESANKSSFWQSLQDFRAKHDLEELEMEADVFADVRDKKPGREVNLKTGINNRHDAKL
jgi:hypothetical protein